MPTDSPVVTATLYPGESWQELRVYGLLVAHVWGAVTEIKRTLHVYGPETYCICIGEPGNTSAFYHVNAYVYAEIKKEVTPSCQS